MTLKEQLAYFDAHAGELYDAALKLQADPAYKESVLALARERLITAFPTYGDLMFRWPPDRLYSEEMQEHADAVNYRLARHVQR